VNGIVFLTCLLMVPLLVHRKLILYLATLLNLSEVRVS
jgi:hypothetical protein